MVDGLVGIFGGKKQKHSLGVCIPEPRSKEAEKQAAWEEKDEKVDTLKGFQVEGIFHFHDSMMLQGTVIGATIRKNAKAKIGGVKLTVSDIIVDRRRTSMISDGEKGALFLKAPKDKYPFIRIGDLIEF